jgi:hypothetical protein
MEIILEVLGLIVGALQLWAAYREHRKSKNERSSKGNQREVDDDK